MNICVFGIGGVGGSVGGMLCGKLHEREDYRVHFIARGNHRKAILENGLELKLPDQRVICCRPSGVYPSLREAPVPDAVLLCVKAYDLPLVTEELSDIGNPDMMVIPVMNGFDIYQRVRKNLKTGLVFPSCIYIGGRKTGDGECNFYFSGPLVYGADPMRKDHRPEKLITLLDEIIDKTYLDVKWVEDPYPAIWQKYMFNVAVNLMNAYTGKTLGEIMADAALKQMTRDILHETVEVIKRTPDAPVFPDAEGRIWEIIEKAPASTKSAYAVDIENHSRRNEGEIFGRAIIELGRKAGAETRRIEEVFGEIETRLSGEQEGWRINIPGASLSLG
ncbi:MAG: hypothetical protein GX089_09065 [Fibrobacter sp.]|nr:hypothetical protein [Fibrobacter sp.]